MPDLKLNPPESFELSLGQKELWFIHSMEGQAQSAYNEPLIYTLEGYLQVNALKQAFQALIDKHELLRASFDTDADGNLFQSVNRNVPVDFTVIELNNDAISDYIASVVHKPFNLKKAPMMRVSLVKKSLTEYVLIIVLHHIITDGTSFSIFINELNSFYSQIMRGEFILSQNKTSFYDHVIFEQENFASLEYQEKLNETVETLKGYSGLNFLTTPKASENSDIYSGNHVYFTLDKAIYEQVNHFCKTHRVTIFHVLYATYSLLISRYTRTQDVLIGVPFANRQADVEKEIIGYFINTIPTRLILDEKDNFLNLCMKVKSLIFSWLSKQEVAFEHIRPQLNLERKAYGLHPLIQTLFVWGNTDKLQLKFEGIHATLKQQYPSKTSKFDLSLFMLEENKEVTGYFEYRDTLFEKEMVARFATSFKTLLSNILKNPEGQLNSFSLLDESEKGYMKEHFFTAKLNRKVTQSLGELFSETACRYPQNIGLIFGHKRYDYQTIEERSNQWASYIRATYFKLYGKELSADTLIALCTDRNEDMIFGMLGILKAGAAYVPVDPKYPQDRINYIINHSQASLLLTHKKQDELNLDFDADKTIYTQDL